MVNSCLNKKSIWGSFKQWQEMGGNVRKGEKGTQVVFYSQITKSEIKPTDLNPVNQMKMEAYHAMIKELNKKIFGVNF